MATLEKWKRKDLSDEEILTQEHLNRVATQGPAQKSEIIYCACGCGEFWLSPVNHEGRKQRHLRGHAPRRTPPKTRAELIAISNSLTRWIQEKGTSYGWTPEGS